jgi:hypothetical protein
MTKRLIGSMLGLVLLGSCATMNARWDACEKTGSTFVELADCTAKAVQADASTWTQPTLRMRSEARAKRFSVKAEDLIEKVGAGRMPDPEARVELRKALDQLVDEERDDRLVPNRQPQKAGVTCSPTGTSVSCTAN